MDFRIWRERRRGSALPGLALPGLALLALAASGLALSPPAHAAGSHAGGHHDAAGGGMMGAAAPAAEADRTVRIRLLDNRYDPAVVEVSAGETVRFVVTNDGSLVHEFNLGTPAMHAAHQKEMMEMVDAGVLEADRINHDKMSGGHGMDHDDPNSVLLEPGQSGEVVWTFPEEGSVEIACNVPGHYEAGMKGEVAVH